MGVSDPEIRKRFSEPRWLLHKHLSETQNWPWWKRFIHHFQRCSICLSNEKSPGCVKTGASKEEPNVSSQAYHRSQEPFGPTALSDRPSLEIASCLSNSRLKRSNSCVTLSCSSIRRCFSCANHLSASFSSSRVASIGANYRILPCPHSTASLKNVP